VRCNLYGDCSALTLYTSTVRRGSSCPPVRPVILPEDPLRPGRPPDGRRGALDPHLQKSCPTSDGLRAHQPPARLVGPSSPHRDSIPPAASSGRRPHIAELPRRKMAAAAPAASTTPASATVPPPHDDAAPAPAAAAAAPPTSAPEQRAGGLFAVPGPVRQLFKLFPLCVYPAESLPARAPAQVRRRPRLYVFLEDEPTLRGDISFNPTCLKWQASPRPPQLP